MTMRIIALAAALLCFTTTARAEEYFFPQVGMTVLSVDGWTVVSGQDFIAMNQKASFGTDDLDGILHSYTDAPIFSMLSDIRDNSGVRAGFNVFAFEGALPDIDAAAKNIEDYLLQSFRDAELVRPWKHSSLGGEPAMHLALTYTVDIQDSASQSIYEEMWLIPRKTNYVTVSYGTLESDTDPELWRDLRRTLNSVAWTN